MFKLATVLLSAATVSAWQSDVDLIKSAEGYRSCTYKDTKGIKTVCYGFNLERGSTSKNRVAQAGGDYNSLINGGCTTQTVCNNLLTPEVQSARNTVQQQYGNTISCPAA